MYDGTLYGHWQAIVTFQQMIVLADADGIVDMTPQAMAARTSIPLEIIQAGLPILESADPYSRTPGQDGRRIELLDQHRPWGWHIVNHEKYKRLRDADELREQNRERQQRFRDRGSVTQSNAKSRGVTQSNAKSRHTYTDTDTTPLPPSGVFAKFWSAWPKNDRKQARGKCAELWQKKNFDLQAGSILAHVEALKASTDWKKDAGRYVPAPLVYLNQRRWEGAEAPAPGGERWSP
jgi:hypothetical protein